MFQKCDQLWCCVVFVLLLSGFVQLQRVRHWGLQPQYASNKIPEDALRTDRDIVKQKIVSYHNFFRSKVEPPASNMLSMSWHPGAAKQAQRYAEECKFLTHNSHLERTVPRLGACGQNIFVSSQKTPWFFAIKNWFLEYKDFTYGSPNYNITAIGHYTQMVWATTFKVGCGIAKCPGGPWGLFYNYVCNYCPGGNIDTKIQYPYKAGKPCTDCPNDCTSKLCRNSCPARDVYDNCKDMVSYPGVCGQGVCNATCSCGDKRIHRNYPF